MTIYYASAPDTGGAVDASRIQGPDGPPKQAAPWLFRPALWYPQAMPPQKDPATLFILDARDEQDVLDRGGRMGQDATAYFDPATVKTSLVAGPFARKAVAETTAAGGALHIPIVGLAPDPTTQDFTIVGRWKPKSVAGGSTTKGSLLWVGSEDGNYGILLYCRESGADSLTAAWRIAGSAVGKATLTGLVSGDWPADTWTAISIIWDHAAKTLTLKMGNNSKTVTGSALVTMPPAWAFENGYYAPLTDAARTATSGEWEHAEGAILFGKRTPGASVDYVESPKVAVDFGTDNGTVSLPDMGGLFAQYPGWRDAQVDGQLGGGGPGVTGNAIRDALFDIYAEAGCTVIRRDHIFDKELTITGTAASPTISDWTAHDAVMDQIQAKFGSSVKMHMTFGYTPSILGASRSTPPTSNTGFAKLCSDAITHWKAKYGTSVVANNWWFMLWNEPSGGSFWSGTPSQFSALWLAVQAKLAVDHPDVSFGAADSVFSSGAATPERQVIIDAALASKPIPFIGWHAYEIDDYAARNNVADMLAYLVTKSYSATTPIRVGEWAYSQSRISLWGSGSNSKDIRLYRGHPTGTIEYAAACFRRIWHMVDAGVVSAIFTRMGILDDSYVGEEQFYGLFTHDNPPRPLPAFATFQGVWKLAGQRKTASTNRPWLKALAAQSTGGVRTFMYGAWRPWEPKERLTFGFQLSGLPATFTWEQWRKDHRDTDDADGRLRLIDQGTQDDFPLGADLTAQGVGLIQITPS